MTASASKPRDYLALVTPVSGVTAVADAAGFVAGSVFTLVFLSPPLWLAIIVVALGLPGALLLVGEIAGAFYLLPCRLRRLHAEKLVRQARIRADEAEARLRHPLDLDADTGSGYRS